MANKKVSEGKTLSRFNTVQFSKHSNMVDHSDRDLPFANNNVIVIMSLALASRSQDI